MKGRKSIPQDVNQTKAKHKSRFGTERDRAEYVPACPREMGNSEATLSF